MKRFTVMLMALAAILVLLGAGQARAQNIVITDPSTDGQGFSVSSWNFKGTAAADVVIYCQLRNSNPDGTMGDIVWSNGYASSYVDTQTGVQYWNWTGTWPGTLPEFTKLWLRVMYYATDPNPVPHTVGPYQGAVRWFALR
jgi:hypothetical protein